MRVYFGALALSSGFLTLDQLAAAVARQKELSAEDSPPRKIGEICAEMGYLKEEQIHSLLDCQARRNRDALQNASFASPRSVPSSMQFANA